MQNVSVIRLGVVVAWVASAILFTIAALQVVQASDVATAELPSAPVVFEPWLGTSTTVARGPLGAPPSVSEATTPLPSHDPPSETRVVETRAGSLSVAYAEGGVRFVSGTPNIGWTIDIGDRGPGAVKATFEMGGTNIQVWVGWRDDELSVDIDEEGNEG